MTEPLPVSRAHVFQSILQLVLILLFIFLIVRAVGLEDIQQYVTNAGAWGPLILIVLKASTLIVAPLGGSPRYPIAGALYGFSEGFIYMFIGDTVGTVITFYLSRIFGQPIIKYFVGSNMPAIEKILDHVGTLKGLIQARLFFIAFQEGVSYAAGLTKIAFWPFMGIHMGIGILPSALLVLFGSVLIEESAVGVMLFVHGGALLLAILGALWFYRVIKKT